MLVEDAAQNGGCALPCATGPRKLAWLESFGQHQNVTFRFCSERAVHDCPQPGRRRTALHTILHHSTRASMRPACRHSSPRPSHNKSKHSTWPSAQATAPPVSRSPFACDHSRYEKLHSSRRPKMALSSWATDHSPVYLKLRSSVRKACGVSLRWWMRSACEYMFRFTSSLSSIQAD